MSRRSKRALVVAAGVLVAAGLWMVWFEPAGLTVVRERVAIGNTLRGELRIAVLSDLHVGSPFNGLDKLGEIVRRTNEEKPDVVCILGDLVIHSVVGGQFVAPEATATELARLRAAAGVVAVLGNHDSWLDHGRVKTALETNGVPVIEETAIRLDTRAGPVWFAGISDLWTRQADVTRALAAVRDDGPVVLLTHNPDVFPDVPSRVALTIAGHTHGGQVALPFIGRPVVPSRFGQRFAAGLIREDGRQLFVATGLGTSIIPVRFRVLPSISVLTLAGR